MPLAPGPYLQLTLAPLSRALRAQFELLAQRLPARQAASLAPRLAPHHRGMDLGFNHFLGFSIVSFLFFKLVDFVVPSSREREMFGNDVLYAPERHDIREVVTTA